MSDVPTLAVHLDDAGVETVGFTDGGYLDGKALDPSEISKLATLPNLKEIRGTLVGLLVAPATKLVRLLNEPGAQLARLVEARRSSLEESGDE